MMQQVIIIVAIAALSILICYIIYKWLFTPRQKKVVRVSIKRSQQVDKVLSYHENEKVTKMKVSIANFFGNMPIIRLSPEDRDEIHKLIISIDKRVKSGRLLLVEEFYFNQLLIAGAILLVSVLGVIITPFTLAGILLIPFGMRIPVMILRSERNQFALSLANEFLDFYRLYYVQFIRPDNVTTLSYVINSYMPAASIEVKKILKVVDGDLGKGEEYALKRFDQRFPDSPKVHKFCTIAQARIKGDDTCYETMRTFLALLQEEHDVYFNNERQKRENRLNFIVNTFLTIGASIVCFVAFAMFIIG